ncbi:hypothetical protein [Aminobacter sp. AP02]|uniref:hypothetical protein n=1 Tax=Aminobacter sp. AP02 TaxID=2135737 RepID=UPI000D6D1619|nr:hypothetical protein [Aminobacter sp. AP02]PWK72638.1 hypothetical protein C8K44_10579 [Aminobacter sp. AP02]
MKTVLLAVCLTMLAAEALAQSRYITTSMSCAQTRNTVVSRGAAILQWRSVTSGVQRYDRYVRDDSFCPTGQYAERAWVPTADTKSCPVYKCKQIENDDFFLFRRRIH